MNDPERERPQIDNDLAEALGSQFVKMTGFDYLAMVYMIAAEATQAALGKQGATDQELAEAVTDAVNEWMNVQKDWLLGFMDEIRPPHPLSNNPGGTPDA